MRYATLMIVARVEERFRREWVRGIGKDAETRLVSTGWWIITEAPEPTAFCVGPEKPPFGAGCEIRITLEDMP